MEMIRLDDTYMKNSPIQSSKGNQFKWEREGVWYKADYTGYEGLAEYMVSGLLQYSNLEEMEFIQYQTEEIGYKKAVYRGCKSQNFLPDGWQLITLERLFKNFYGACWMCRFALDCFSKWFSSMLIPEP